MKKLSTILLLMALAVPSFADDALTVQVKAGQLTVEPLADNAVRVKCVKGKTAQLDELIYTPQAKSPKYKVRKGAAETRVELKEMTVVFNHQTETLRYLDKRGNVVLEEKAGGRSVSMVDIKGTPMADVAQQFLSPADEHLFGTGQFQDGYLNIKGLTRRLTQVNTQIAIPFVLSSKGYGLQWNNYGLTNFNPSAKSVELQGTDEQGNVIEVDATSTLGNRRERRQSDTFRSEITLDSDGDYAFLLDIGQSMARKLYLAIDGDIIFDINNTWLPPTCSAKRQMKAGKHTLEVKGVRGDKPTVSWRKDDNTTTLQSPAAQALDYTVMVGNADRVIATYRHLTGEAPLMPDYMLGYVHCRERYSSSQEIIDNANTFRQKNIPLDVIVQDWQWWGKYGWNAMQFDEDHYPDPALLTKTLHDMDVRLMLSVWSKVDKNSIVGRELSAGGYYIDGTDWIDFFNPDAAACYWRNFSQRLVPYNIDVWWLDATEPENDDLMGRRVGKQQLPGEVYRNVYPTKVVSTVYNGLKEMKPEETPVILTRSAFSGMQRYNAVTWSGDVGNDMDCLRRQIAGGLNYTASGFPWWTYDAGGFFRPGNQYQDKAYNERMLRWIQCSVFLPIMRVHGYMSQTEPWRYPAETERIFVNCIKERKALEPYLKRCARMVAEQGYTLMRPLVFDFADDPEALRQETEYMFGPDYLVCPITEEGVSEWTVYLPKNKRGWDDIYSGKHYDGGQTVRVAVTMEHIPVFRRK